jgi:hypothetical protein
MDNRNNAKVNPNSRDVSDAKMRCLVKTLALFGLGHYIYAGEDLPPSGKEEKVEEKVVKAEKPKKEPVKEETKDWTSDPKKYADTFVTPMLALIDKAEDVVSLKELFVNNKSHFKVLEEQVPEEYKKLIDKFMKKTNAFEKEIGDADTK